MQETKGKSKIDKKQGTRDLIIIKVMTLAQGSGKRFFDERKAGSIFEQASHLWHEVKK